jgi:hypothetical protein
VVSPPPRKQPRRPVRSAPRFSAFLLTGGLIGLAAGFFLSVVGPVDSSYDPSAALGFLGLIGAGLGILAGGGLAVLLDRRH